MASGYVLTASDLMTRAMAMGNLWKGLLSATNGYLTRLNDEGNTAITNAYGAGGSATAVQDLIDLRSATTAMTNAIEYVQYAGSVAVTDNTGGAGLATPTAGPTVTPQNPVAGDATTYYYQLIFHTLNGTTAGYTGAPPNAVVGSTTTGHASLNGTTYNLVTWTPPVGVTQTDVLWWNGAAWRLKGTVSNTSIVNSSFADTGQADSAYTVPTTNTTAGTTQTVSVPNGSICVVTSDPTIAATLRPIGTDQSPYIRKPSDLTAGTT